MNLALAIIKELYINLSSVLTFLYGVGISFIYLIIF